MWSKLSTRLFCFVWLISFCNGNEHNLRKKHQRRKINEIYQIVNKIYDRKYPELNESDRSSVKKFERHLRCVVDRPVQAADEYVEGLWRNVSRNHEIFVHAPCLWLYRLGNMLSQYFEGISCAHLAGLHYISVAKTWHHEVENASVVNHFFDKLPSFIEHHEPSTRDIIVSSLKKQCTCQYRCHELPNAVWPKSLYLIKSIMQDALLHHVLKTNSLVAGTKVLSGDIANVPLNTALPLIPVMMFSKLF